MWGNNIEMDIKKISWDVWTGFAWLRREISTDSFGLGDEHSGPLIDGVFLSR
jgi:hypothetical protein